MDLEFEVAPDSDVEKATPQSGPGSQELAPVIPGDGNSTQSAAFAPPDTKLSLLAQTLERVIGLEARGIHRVEDHEKTAKTTMSGLQIFLLWISINTAAQNITLAMICQSVYGLGFVDAALCSVAGGVAGSIIPAYIATLGPISGNRTLIFSRYTMGWWPTKICVLLNLVIILGYSTVDAVIAGEMLSAVSPDGSLSVAVGIIVVVVITWIVSTFGIRVFNFYERYAWVPQLIAFFILASAAGPKFDVTTKSTGGDEETIIANRISFFSMCFSSAITYTPSSADFLVYCNAKLLSRTKVFVAVFMGLSLSFSFCFMLGTGLASGASSDQTLVDGVGSGALIVSGFDSLGSFGKFCAVVVALGLISNMIPPVYCFGIDLQILGRYPAMIPRFLWNTLGVILFAACALAGRQSLSAIFTNFLALMGYWVAIWIAITLEEQLVFRRYGLAPPFNWNDWNNKNSLPIGMAALVAFLVGWAGAILCMAQTYYVGPLASLVGENGVDIGNYVGFLWAALVFPPLRYWELKKFGR